jgi:phage terminase small subunit
MSKQIGDVKDDEGLTRKQRAFAQYLVQENGRATPTECAKMAGYSEHSATQIACNLQNPKMYPKVVDFIDTLTKEYSKASKIEFQKHAREMARLRDMAVEEKQYSAAINAEYRRGLLGGFYVERKEVVTASLDNMSRKELQQKLENLRKENQLIQDVEYSEIEDQSDIDKSQ